jgi:YggT family protein
MTDIHIGQILAGLIGLYTSLVVIWCLLSWFPNIKWGDQPFRTLDQIVAPVIAPLRRLLPTVGGIDFSPVLAILALNFLARICIDFLP